MTNYISAMPIWATSLFIACFLFCIVFISLPVRKAALIAGMTVSKSRNIQFGVLAFYFLYLAYVSMLCLTGAFATNSIPPRVVILGAVPLTVFLFGIIGNTNLFKKLLHSISLESLVSLHVFRFVGVFFIILHFYRLLPVEFSFSAGLGDIITAALALPVAKSVSKRKAWSTTAVYAWNIFGVLDILVLLVIAAIDAQNSIITGASGDREMTIFPFMWYPAFAPATILFLHTAVFRKLHQLKTAEVS